tara:strand:+ start:48 stop:314 length:267 start_codon:yes stop_codon:yes gene_type:complete
MKMKWWSKHLTIVIAKTASRNVVFKAAKMNDSALTGQSAVLTGEVAGAGSSIDEEVLKNLGRNADLYIFNQSVMRYAGLSFCFHSATC